MRELLLVSLLLCLFHVVRTQNFVCTGAIDITSVNFPYTYSQNFLNPDDVTNLIICPDIYEEANTQNQFWFKLETDDEPFSLTINPCQSDIYVAIQILSYLYSPDCQGSNYFCFQDQ